MVSRISFWVSFISTMVSRISLRVSLMMIIAFNPVDMAASISCCVSPIITVKPLMPVAGDVLSTRMSSITAGSATSLVRRINSSVRACSASHAIRTDPSSAFSAVPDMPIPSAICFIFIRSPTLCTMPRIRICAVRMMLGCPLDCLNNTN